MPQYRYACENCGSTVDDFRPIDEREAPGPKCKCGLTMTWVFATRAGNAAYHKPIELFSMAPETPEQRRQLEKVGATFNREGVPLARDRAEKNRLMKAADTVELN